MQYIVYYYLEFKFCYLKNLELFLNRVNEVIEPILLMFARCFTRINIWLMFANLLFNKHFAPFQIRCIKVKRRDVHAPRKC